MICEADGWVYMITEQGCGRFVKIGFSTRGVRISQTFNPRLLIEVDKFLSHREGETALHQRLKKFRVRNEWFFACREVYRIWEAEKRFWSDTVFAFRLE